MIRKARSSPPEDWPPMPGLPRWPHWLSMPTVGIREAVALSLEAEPSSVEQYVKNVDEELEQAGRRVTVDHGRPNRRRIVRWHFPWMTEDGIRRLDLLLEAYGTEQLPAMSQSHAQTVRLVDVARFALRHGWKIPDPMAALLPGEQRDEGSESRPAAAEAPSAAVHSPVQVPQGKADDAHAALIERALVNEGFDLANLPLYRNGARSGDPAKAAARRALRVGEEIGAVLSVAKFESGWTQLMRGKPRRDTLR